MDVSIIIVSFNTKDLLKNCLKSIYSKTKNIDFEIIVVDNASSDGSQQLIKVKFPNVILIENSQNFGFGKANNIGAKGAKGKYFLFLNSDCVLIDNSIKKFYDFIEQNKTHKKIGAVGAMLYDLNMVKGKSYFKFPSKSFQIRKMYVFLINKLFCLSIPPPHNENYKLINNEVDFISGADLFIPKDVFFELNGFDEQFFLYFEETDLQYRMAKKGFKRILLKDQKIIHLEGVSSKTKKPRMKKLTIHRDSMFKYYKKNSNYLFYFTFYLLIIPLLIFPIFNRRYSKNEKIIYLRMLLQNI